MTLTTRVRIADPINPERVFRVALDQLVGRCAHVETRTMEHGGWRGRMVVETVPGQGLSAWLSVRWDQDSPLSKDEDGEPDGCVEVVWDTGYDYDGPEGGCEALHRDLSGRLGAWLDGLGVGWHGYDEHTGRWYVRSACPQI